LYKFLSLICTLVEKARVYFPVKNSPTLHSRWLLFLKVMIISLWNLLQYRSIVRWAIQAQWAEPLVYKFTLHRCLLPSLVPFGQVVSEEKIKPEALKSLYRSPGNKKNNWSYVKTMSCSGSHLGNKLPRNDHWKVLCFLCRSEIQDGCHHRS
jgi:hypothetical protein